MEKVNRGSENEHFKQIKGDGWLSTYLPAISAGVVMTVVLLVAISCSKKSDTPGAQISAPAAVRERAPAESQAASVAPTAPKKTKKHRATSATYINGAYGVSFTYPRKYSLEVGNKNSLSPVESGFLKPGAIEIASVDLPGSLYEETDFSSALLNVAVNPEVSSAECAQFRPSAMDSDSAAPASVKIGTNEFTELERLDESSDRHSDLKYFHLFKNAACYEFALDVETSRKAGEDLAQVDRGKVFAQLERILATARVEDKELPGTEKADQLPSPETPPMPAAEVVATDER